MGRNLNNLPKIQKKFKKSVVRNRRWEKQPFPKCSSTHFKKNLPANLFAHSQATIPHQRTGRHKKKVYTKLFLIFCYNRKEGRQLSCLSMGLQGPLQGDRMQAWELLWDLPGFITMHFLQAVEASLTRKVSSEFSFLISLPLPLLLIFLSLCALGLGSASGKHAH